MRSYLGPVLRDYSVGLHRLARVLSIVSACAVFSVAFNEFDLGRGGIADLSVSPWVFAFIWSALGYWAPIFVVKIGVWVFIGFRGGS